jgi:hypothetical protein
MAITAVAADFFRRSVVVDIINWPVLYIFYIAGFPAGLRQWSQTLIGAVPLVQTFTVLANGSFPNRKAIFTLRGVLVTFLGRENLCQGEQDHSKWRTA